MLWSLIDYIFRCNFFPEHSLLILRIGFVVLATMAVQLHVFLSSFYIRGQKRWLPFAYASLAVIVIMIAAGYLPEGVTIDGNNVYPDYGNGIIIFTLPLLTLAARNFYVFIRRLKILNSPVLRNQIISLIIGLGIITFFTLTALLPGGREFPISHLGNAINAIVLSYATVRHKLVDINLVIRQGVAWIILVGVGILAYWLLLLILHTVFKVNFDFSVIFLAAVAAGLVAIPIYKVRKGFFATMNKVFQGESYDYRQKLYDFANRIHSIFSLEDQGSELLSLVTRAVGCRKAALLFLEIGSKDFISQLVEPKERNPLGTLRLKEHNPIVEYLRREKKALAREQITILPEFLSLWGDEKSEIGSNEVELFLPLISRQRLIGILVLDRKKSGRYTLEDFILLEEVTNRVAISMEKEYLQEQLKEREEELSIINRSSAIITSSFNIQTIYDNFIQELKKVVEVSWAAICLIEGDSLHFLAISSDLGSPWQVGERIPLKGSATEHLAIQRQAIIEPDLAIETRFSTGKYHLSQGARSIVYLPLKAKDNVIGSLIVASRHPNAYTERHIHLLERLASQIAMPIENSQLYAKTEQMARIDELTGLLNRRSLDEQLPGEVSRHSRYGGVFSLIVFDLDSFKSFNDNYGHLAGDKLLKQVGSITKGAMRGSDQAFRYGGDEFAVLLPQTAIEAAYQVAERIRKRVASEMKASRIPVSVSLGLASWPADGLNANDLINAADKALYQAQRSGGNQSNRASGTLLFAEDTTVNVADKSNEDLSTIYALAAMVDARDHYTRNHSKRVSEYVVAMGEALHLEPLEISKLSTCALLHDIGKIGINDEILNKTGKLTAEEWEEIKTHPQLGATIASHARQLMPYMPGILHHHERYDGKGYPEGLKGEEIPFEARVLAIADAFAAMTSERHYSTMMPIDEAIEEIKRSAGKQFDPQLVEVFLTVIKSRPITITKK